MSIINIILDKLQGSHKTALKAGLNEGKGVTVMGGVYFGNEPYLITLEDEVRVSFGVSFITHDGGTWAFRDIPQYKDVIKYGKIKVGKRSFIGAKSIIMPGVTIGNRCVIGAGSIVTSDVPDGHVAVGCPAKVIMTTEEYAEKCFSSQREYDKEAYSENKREYLTKWL